MATSTANAPKMAPTMEPISAAWLRFWSLSDALLVGAAGAAAEDVGVGPSGMAAAWRRAERGIMKARGAVRDGLMSSRMLRRFEGGLCYLR